MRDAYASAARTLSVALGTKVSLDDVKKLHKQFGNIVFTVNSNTAPHTINCFKQALKK